MHGKTICLVCMVFLCLPILSGCWDSLDIEKRTTVLGIAIDKAQPGSKEDEDDISHLNEKEPVEDEEMIRLTAQIAVPGRIPLGPETSSGGGEQQKPVWVLSVTGHTINDAILNLQQEVANEIFLGHLRIIIISEEVAREGIQQFNDYLRRQPEVRRTAWLAISKEKAHQYMKIMPKLERVPALYLTEMVENFVDLGRFPNDFIGIFWRELSSKGQDAYLPYLQIKGEENVQLKGLAYFKSDKMVGALKPIEIGLFMALIGQPEGGYGAFFKIPGTEKNVLARAGKRRVKIKTMIKDGKPEARINIRYEVEVDEKENGINLDDPAIIRKIEEQANKDVSESVKRIIKQTQEDEADIFGFGEYFRAKHPSYWNKEVKTIDHWRHIFKELDVHVETDTHIRRVGMKAR